MKNRYIQWLQLFVSILLLPIMVNGQPFSISTTSSFLNNNGSGSVTFNIHNTNSYPVRITEVKGIVGTSGSVPFQMYLRNDTINANVGTINAANGWNLVASNTFTGVSNTTSLVTQTFMSGMNVVIPGNTSRGVVLYADGQRYYSIASNTYPSFTNGGVVLQFGQNISYGGGAPPTAGTFNPRGFIGEIFFEVVGSSGFSNDAGIAELLTPTNFCSGSQAVTVKLNNYGNNTLSNVTVNWSVDNVNQTPVVFSTPLDTMGSTGISSATVNLGNYVFTSNPHTIRVWTSNPNNTTDPNTSNDTIVAIVRSSLSGTYTINSAAATSGTNFQTFGAFVSALNTYGVCGPVVANVNPTSGPYNEKLDFGAIPGASSINTIRVNGNGRTVQYTATTTYEPMLTMAGTKFVTIDSLVFKSLSSTYGYGAILSANCENDTITRCTFDLSSVTSTSSANGTGIRITSVPNSTNSTASGAINSYIAYNKILGNPNANNGIYYGIYAYGPNNNLVIANNTLQNFYLYGAYIYYGNNVKVLNNVLTRQTKQNAGYCYGLINGYLTAGSKIIGNRVEYLGGANNGTTYCYPLQVNYSVGTAANPVLVANNVVNNMTTVPLNGGIYINGGSYIDVYHNTINIDRPINYSSTTTQAGIQSSSTTAKIINNNINYTGGGTNTKYGIYYSSAPATSNYNNVYMNSTQSGTQYYGYSGSAYATLAAFQGGTIFEDNGTSVASAFVNATAGNLLPTNQTLMSSGTNLLSIVSNDIIGVPRKPTPTPGAYEIAPTVGPSAGIYAFISPDSVFCANQQSIQVSIINSGSVPLTNILVNWSLNGVTQTPYVHAASVPPFSSGTNIVNATIGSINIPNGTNTLKIWTSVSGDVYNLDDTLVRVLMPSDFSVVVQNDTLCYGKNVQLSLLPSSGYATGMIQWQSSINGTTFTNITGANQPTLTDNNLTQNKWYRAFINSGTGGCYSDTQNVVAVIPQILSAINDTLCGSGIASLEANAAPGATVKWYDAAVAGNLVHTGSNFTTPLLNSSTVYYVQPTVGSDGEAILSNGTLITQSGSSAYSPLSPFAYHYGNYKHQILILASELQAQGLTPGDITSLSFDVASIGSPAGTFNNFNVSLMPTTLGNLTTTFQTTGLQNVFSGNITPAAGLYKFNFTTPFTWDGISNVIVQTCYNNNNSGNVASSAEVYYDNTSFTSVAVWRADGSQPNACSQTTASYTYSTRPKMILEMKAECSGPRVPVTAEVKPIVSAVTSPTGNVGLCDGTNRVLSSVNTASNYLWLKDGVAIPNSNSATYSASATGAYRLVTIEGTCTDTSAVVNVVMSPSPLFSLGNDLTICPNSSTILSVPGNQGTILWDNNSTSTTRTVSAPGIYYATITNNYGCSYSDSILVSNFNHNAIDLGSDKGICPSEFATLTATGYSSVLWNTGATSASISVDSGMYTVYVTDNNGCSSRDTINVSYLPYASVNGFTFVPYFYEEKGKVQFNPINPTNVVTYYWEFGDGNTSTLRNPLHTYSDDGMYMVKLHVSNGSCPAEIDTQVINIDFSVGLEDIEVASAKLYPNPATDQINIEFESLKSVIDQVNIYDKLGRIHSLPYNVSNTKIEVNTQLLVSGLYHASIKMKDGTVMRIKFEIIK